MNDLLGPVPHDPGGKSKPAWPSGSVVTARFSDCGCYRYELSEVWYAAKPLCMWLMMNPSVAGIAHSDPTLIKTGKYSRSWGYGGQLVGNVHAYRATDSARLAEVVDPIGYRNRPAVMAMAKRAAIVVLAYGQVKVPRLRAHGAETAALLRDAGADLRYLRLAKDGTPYHPLYLPGALVPLRFGGDRVPDPLDDDGAEVAF